MAYNALIVDDSRLACKVLADMLEPLKITSMSVYSAEQALDYLKSHQPDIIFLDHTMPGMNGLQTIKVIKDNPKTAMVPVVMYTAKEGEVYVGQARALGAVDVIPKGTETEHLYNALHQLGMLGDDGIRQLKQKQTRNQKAKHSAEQQVAAAVFSPMSKSSSDNEKPSIVEPNWRQVWQQQIAPYLLSQSHKQTEEISQFSLRQTRYLNREIHKTLEHFEHALMSRLEAHDDFLAIKQEAANQRRRRWVGAVVGMVVLIQVGFIGFFYQSYDATQKLIARQQAAVEWQVATSAKIDQVNEKIVLLESQSVSQQDSVDEVASAQWTLQNARQEHLAQLKPLNNASNDYQGVSETGYQFTVNAKGELSSLVDEQYFLTDNCQGDAFVDSLPAQVLTDRQGELWFTDKNSEWIEINVNSRLTPEQECFPMQSEPLALRRLQINLSFETGVESPGGWQLVYNQ